MVISRLFRSSSTVPARAHASAIPVTASRPRAELPSRPGPTPRRRSCRRYEARVPSGLPGPRPAAALAPELAVLPRRPRTGQPLATRVADLDAEYGAGEHDPHTDEPVSEAAVQHGIGRSCRAACLGRRGAILREGVCRHRGADVRVQGISCFPSSSTVASRATSPPSTFDTRLVLRRGTPAAQHQGPRARGHRGNSPGVTGEGEVKAQAFEASPGREEPR